MNEIAPRLTTMNPAPAETYASFTLTRNPFGAPERNVSYSNSSCVMTQLMRIYIRSARTELGRVVGE